MANLEIKCTKCGRNFFSGIKINPGNTATFIRTMTQCKHCGFAQFIPDGSFKGREDGSVEFKQTVQIFVDILKQSPNPLNEIKEIFEALKSSKTADDLQRIKQESKFIKFEKWLPNSPEKIAAYLAIIYTVIQLLTKNPTTDIKYSNFINQYNQINIIDNRK